MTGVAATSLPRSVLLPVSRHWSEIAASVYGAAVVGLVAGSSGGFLATTWGWTAVVTLWLAAMALLLRDEIRLGALELTYVGGMLAFTGWVALSNLWTPSVTSTMHEVQRDIAYTGVVAAGLVLVRRRAARYLVGGVLVGIFLDSLYGLGTRVLPDRFGGFDSTSFDYRLSAPITYWNGLGIFATMGLLLALGFATRGRHIVTRAFAAATLPLFAATIYFTFSRGAWYALVLGLIAAIAVEPRRLQFLAIGLLLAPWTVLAVVEVRKEHGLVTGGSTLEEATRDGHHLVPRLLVLVLISGVAAAAACLIERHVPVPRAVRLGFGVLIVLALLAGAAQIWHTKGSPETLAKRGWHAFQGSATRGQNGNVAARLTSFSADGRIPLWRVSWRDFRHAPILGDGAGTFWESWVRYRTVPSSSGQAHSLYLGVLGELGIVGLVCLLAAVVAPIVGGVAARTRSLVPMTLGAYIAWAAHAGIDWDWALLGTTIPALLCGVALLKDQRQRARTVGTSARVAAFVATTLLLVAALPVLVADLHLRAGQQVVASNPSQALADARVARRFAPWSSEPYLLMADAYARERMSSRVTHSLEQAIARDSSNWSLWRLMAAAGSEHQRAEARARLAVLNPLQGVG